MNQRQALSRRSGVVPVAEGKTQASGPGKLLTLMPFVLAQVASAEQESRRTVGLAEPRPLYK